MTFTHDAEIPFTKMTGSGNDFVVIDHRAPLFDPDEVSEFARAVCRRGLAIGADGVVLIEDAGDEDVDFRWRYIFTPDGVVTAVVENPHKPKVRIGVSDPGPIRREKISVEGIDECTH